VLAEIADDYEEPKHVWENVEQRARFSGIAVTKSEIYHLLLQAVADGLAKPYDLAVKGPVVELPVAPPLERIEGYYFWITEKGRDLHLLAREREQWPFDDEGELVPGWVPPTA
jgi:hypothetical protein